MLWELAVTRMRIKEKGGVHVVPQAPCDRTSELSGLCRRRSRILRRAPRGRFPLLQSCRPRARSRRVVQALLAWRGTGTGLRVRPASRKWRRGDSDLRVAPPERWRRSQRRDPRVRRQGPERQGGGLLRLEPGVWAA